MRKLYRLAWPERRLNGGADPQFMLDVVQIEKHSLRPDPGAKHRTHGG